MTIIKSKTHIFILLFYGLASCLSGLYAQQNDYWPRENDLWKVYNETKTDPEKLTVLKNLIHYYQNNLGDNKAVDTLCHRAITLTELSGNRKLILESYSIYFDNQPVWTRQYSEKFIRNTQRLADIGVTNARWHEYYFTALTKYYELDFEKGNLFANQASEIAHKTNQHQLEAKSLLLAGNCNNFLNNRVVALKCYLQAKDLIKQQENNPLNYQILSAMERLYYLYNNNEMAKKYLTKKLDIVTNQVPIDSVEYFSIAYRLLEIVSIDGISKETENEIIDLLKTSKKKGYLVSYLDGWSMWRSLLIENNEFDKLKKLYTDQFPEELEAIKNNDIPLYHRLQAYFSECNDSIETSLEYWNLVIEDISEEQNLYIKTHVFMRYAQFLERNDFLDSALTFGLRAFNMAKLSQFQFFEMKSAGLLADIEVRLGMYQEAFEHLKHKNAIELDINDKTEEERLAILELQHEYEQKDLIRTNEEEKEEAKVQTQFIILITSLLLFILVSTIIFRQYQVTHREKERSDELLLNILPADTAKELKKKGTTTARQYQNVTILICDIVGFTSISEKLTPEKLVQEIDTYFRAFDEIVYNYGMEKIKTVGDAYVAVGGMPLQNNATALHVAKASLALQRKVNELIAIRKETNQPAFELRIGLHTGTVVAGVVGSKKFQYDIWGDAVNIAARMEQNSEPGKINISETTYDLIRHDLRCEPRGKIDAKNKGKIAMYFLTA